MVELTREQIEDELQRVKKGLGIRPIRTEAILTLAFRGLAVTPRPIEEAPKDGTFILAMEASGHWHIVQWYSGGYWRVSVGDVNEGWSPTQFISISTLPTPEPRS